MLHIHVLEQSCSDTLTCTADHVCPAYILDTYMYKMQVDDNFDFASFVSDFLTEEFSRIVKLELLMWVIAILWIAFPDGSYAGFWMTGIFVFLSIVAGGKLHVIAMHLARHAYALFYVPFGDDHVTLDIEDKSAGKGQPWLEARLRKSAKASVRSSGSLSAGTGGSGERITSARPDVQLPVVTEGQTASFRRLSPPDTRLSDVAEGSANGLHDVPRTSHASASGAERIAAGPTRPVGEGAEATDSKEVDMAVLGSGVASPTDVRISHSSHPADSSGSDAGHAQAKHEQHASADSQGSNTVGTLRVPRCGCVPCHMHRRMHHTVKGRLARKSERPASNPRGRNRKGLPNRSEVQFQSCSGSNRHGSCCACSNTRTLKTRCRSRSSSLASGRMRAAFSLAWARLHPSSRPRSSPASRWRRSTSCFCSTVPALCCLCMPSRRQACTISRQMHCWRWLRSEASGLTWWSCWKAP